MEEKEWDKKTERRTEGVTVPWPMMGVLVTIVLQTVGGVWWASSMNTSMAYLKIGQAELATTISTAAANRYTSVDATKDWNANERRLSTLEGVVIANKRDIVDLQIIAGTRRK